MRARDWASPRVDRVRGWFSLHVGRACVWLVTPFRSRRSEPLGERVRCPRCEASYHPALTHFACPVCGREIAPGAAPATLEEPEDRLVEIVVGATILNLLLLGALTAIVLHGGL